MFDSHLLGPAATTAALAARLNFRTRQRSVAASPSAAASLPPGCAQSPSAARIALLASNHRYFSESMLRPPAAALTPATMPPVAAAVKTNSQLSSDGKNAASKDSHSFVVANCSNVDFRGFGGIARGRRVWTATSGGSVSARTATVVNQSALPGVRVGGLTSVAAEGYDDDIRWKELGSTPDYIKPPSKYPDTPSRVPSSLTSTDPQSRDSLCSESDSEDEDENDQTVLLTVTIATLVANTNGSSNASAAETLSADSAALVCAHSSSAAQNRPAPGGPSEAASSSLITLPRSRPPRFPLDDHIRAAQQHALSSLFAPLCPSTSAGGPGAAPASVPAVTAALIRHALRTVAASLTDTLGPYNAFNHRALRASQGVGLGGAVRVLPSALANVLVTVAPRSEASPAGVRSAHSGAVSLSEGSAAWRGVAVALSQSPLCSTELMTFPQQQRDTGVVVVSAGLDGSLVRTVITTPEENAPTPSQPPACLQSQSVLSQQASSLLVCRDAAEHHYACAGLWRGSQGQQQQKQLEALLVHLQQQQELDAKQQQQQQDEKQQLRMGRRSVGAGAGDGSEGRQQGLTQQRGRSPSVGAAAAPGNSGIDSNAASASTKTAPRSTSAVRRSGSVIRIPTNNSNSASAKPGAVSRNNTATRRTSNAGNTSDTTNISTTDTGIKEDVAAVDSDEKDGSQPAAPTFSERAEILSRYVARRPNLAHSHDITATAALPRLPQLSSSLASPVLFATGSSDHSIKIWDLSPHSGPKLDLKASCTVSTSICHRPTSTDSAVSGVITSSDSGLRLGRHMATFRGHRGPVTALCAYPSSDAMKDETNSEIEAHNGPLDLLLFSAGLDGTVRVWRGDRGGSAAVAVPLTVTMALTADDAGGETKSDGENDGKDGEGAESEFMEGMPVPVTTLLAQQQPSYWDLVTNPMPSYYQNKGAHIDCNLANSACVANPVTDLCSGVKTREIVTRGWLYTLVMRDMAFKYPRMQLYKPSLPLLPASNSFYDDGIEQDGDVEGLTCNFKPLSFSSSASVSTPLALAGNRFSVASAHDIPTVSASDSVVRQVVPKSVTFAGDALGFIHLICPLTLRPMQLTQYTAESRDNSPNNMIAANNSKQVTVGDMVTAKKATVNKLSAGCVQALWGALPKHSRLSSSATKEQSSAGSSSVSKYESGHEYVLNSQVLTCAPFTVNNDYRVNNSHNNGSRDSADKIKSLSPEPAAGDFLGTPAVIRGMLTLTSPFTPNREHDTAADSSSVALLVWGGGNALATDEGDDDVSSANSGHVDNESDNDSDCDDGNGSGIGELGVGTGANMLLSILSDSSPQPIAHSPNDDKASDILSPFIRIKNVHNTSRQSGVTACRVAHSPCYASILYAPKPGKNTPSDESLTVLRRVVLKGHKTTVISALTLPAKTSTATNLNSATDACSLVTTSLDGCLRVFSAHDVRRALCRQHDNSAVAIAGAETVALAENSRLDLSHWLSHEIAVLVSKHLRGGAQTADCGVNKRVEVAVCALPLSISGASDRCSDHESGADCIVAVGYKAAITVHKHDCPTRTNSSTTCNLSKDPCCVSVIYSLTRGAVATLRLEQAPAAACSAKPESHSRSQEPTALVLKPVSLCLALTSGDLTNNTIISNSSSGQTFTCSNSNSGEKNESDRLSALLRAFIPPQTWASFAPPSKESADSHASSHPVAGESKRRSVRVRAWSTDAAGQMITWLF